MSYEKQTWVTGEVITAEKLNNMENGIADRTLMIGGFSYEEEDEFTGTADKTWQEIHDAIAVGKECLTIIHDSDTAIRVLTDRAWSYDGKYYIYFAGLNPECNSPDGYPAIPTE